MTATDTIRAMLDERGVEYYPKRPDVTVWSEGGWHIHAQEDMIEGMLELFVRPVTPEQAIEATLGRGELRKERDALDRLTDVLDATNDGLLAENARLREQNRYLMKGDLLHVLTDQELAEQQKREREMQASIKALDDENVKLREQLAKARDPQRIGGTADPESFIYAIEQLREFRWQHATNDEDAIPYINNVADAHERENAKLRELVRELYDELDAATQYDAGGGRGVVSEFADRMRELGVEV